MLRHCSYEVKQAEVVFLLRDWNVKRTGGKDYPQSPTVKQTVPLISSDELTKWVVERIRAHEAAKVQLPRCTDEERWSRPSFAVMKDDKAARAMNGGLFDTREEAEAFIAAKASQAIIQERPGLSERCLYWCPARSVCEQAKEYKPKLEVDKDGFSKVS